MAVGAHVPITQGEIRDFLKIDAAKTSMNARLDKIADGVATAINNYLGVSMITSSYTEIYDGETEEGDPRGNTLWVEKYPIVSITSLADNDIALTSDKYYLYGTEGRIVLKNSGFTPGYQTIDVVYTAGYGASAANIPDALKLACYKWIKAIYAGEIVDFSQQFGESAFARIVTKAIPDDIKFLVDVYKCRGI